MMKEIKFVLEPGDIEEINDCLTKCDASMDLILMFSMIELQDDDLTIEIKKESKEIRDISELLDDLGLEIVDDEDVEKADFDFKYDRPTPEEIREIVEETVGIEPVIQTKPVDLDDKMKVMVQDPNPVAYSEGTVVKKDEERIPIKACFADESLNINTEDRPNPKPADGGEWDDRVPRPVPDENLRSIASKPSPDEDISTEVANDTVDDEDWNDWYENEVYDDIPEDEDDNDEPNVEGSVDHHQQKSSDVPIAWNTNTWHT